VCVGVGFVYLKVAVEVGEIFQSVSRTFPSKGRLALLELASHSREWSSMPPCQVVQNKHLLFKYTTKLLFIEILGDAV
jgi:hypothetical protein